MRILAFCLLTFLASIAIHSFCIKLSDSVGLLDHPGGRKHHLGPTPVVGGVAILLSFWISAVALPGGALSVNLLSATFAIVLVGAWDDRFDIRPVVKLVAQIVIASGAVLLVERPFALHDLPGLPAWMFNLFAIVLLVALMNAYNMMDGSDGLAGGAATVTLSALLVFAATSGASLTRALAPLLISATLGFLAFNAPSPWRRRASVFLGDAGSMLLGLAIGYFLLDLSRASRDPWMISHAMALTAFPLAEMLSLIVRRISAGRSPFSADRNHLHHLLIDNGASPAGTAMTVAIIMLATAILAGSLHHYGASLGLSVAVGAGLVAAHAVLIHVLMERRGVITLTRETSRAQAASGRRIR